MSSENAIKVENLSKCYQIYDQPRDRLKQSVLPRMQRLISKPPRQYYREFWALKDVSFDVKKGETIGIIGHNGSGKSTLLQIITGTLAPTFGSIATHGRIAALLELGSGFNPDFTGRENIYLNGALLGFSRTQIDQKIDDIAAFADIGAHLDQPIKTYSSGMLVRLAFAVQAQVEPDILIVDEALAVGDFMFQQKCVRHMHEVLSGVTKFIVSHDLAAISSMTDRVLVLNKGKLVFDGDTQAGLTVYQKVARASMAGEKLPSEMHQAIHKNPDFTIDLDKWTSVCQEQQSGSGKAKILCVRWSVNDKYSATTIKKGECLRLDFLIEAIEYLDAPIIGYQIQDRFGTPIFGENTVSSFLPIQPMPPGRLMATMELNWPQIAPGDYGVTLGIGNGYDSISHAIECWAHNIIVLGSEQVAPVHGIFNNKISKFTIRKTE